MARLSVNINKFATLRNARGGNNPDIVKTALDCERFGAQGITVHPRPDERHITRDDVYALKEVVTTEFNIEGYPDKRFMDMVLEVKPAQATLVPDPPGVLTSNAGWDTIRHHDFLTEVISELRAANIRTSIFLEPDPKMAEGAHKVGSDRIELYTEHYATMFHKNREQAISDYLETANKAQSLGVGINAGHDLDHSNLAYLIQSIPFIEEVSIGHALVCDALYLGLENTIQMYLRQVGYY